MWITKAEATTNRLFRAKTLFLGLKLATGQ